MRLLVSLFHLAQLILMKGLNRIMNLLDYLLNLPVSDLATLWLLAFLGIATLILSVFLLTFVKSWIAGRTSKSSSQLFQQNLDSSLTTIIMCLKNLFQKVPPTSSSTTTSVSSQDSQAQDSPPTTLSLLQVLEKAVEFLKEDNNNNA